MEIFPAGGNIRNDIGSISVCSKRIKGQIDDFEFTDKLVLDSAILYYSADFTIFQLQALEVCSPSPFQNFYNGTDTYHRNPNNCLYSSPP